MGFDGSGGAQCQDHNASFSVPGRHPSVPPLVYRRLPSATVAPGRGGCRRPLIPPPNRSLATAPPSRRATLALLPAAAFAALALLPAGPAVASPASGHVPTGSAKEKAAAAERRKEEMRERIRAQATAGKGGGQAAGEASDASDAPAEGM